MGSYRVGISCVNSRILYRTGRGKVTVTGKGGYCKTDRGKVRFVTIRKFEVIETGRVIWISNRGVTIRIFGALRG